MDDFTRAHYNFFFLCLIASLNTFRICLYYTHKSSSEWICTGSFFSCPYFCLPMNHLYGWMMGDECCILECRCDIEHISSTADWINTRTNSDRWSSIFAKCELFELIQAHFQFGGQNIIFQQRIGIRTDASMLTDPVWVFGLVFVCRFCVGASWIIDRNTAWLLHFLLNSQNIYLSLSQNACAIIELPDMDLFI